jgi:ATP-dependent Clp protease, protease subunit
VDADFRAPTTQVGDVASRLFERRIVLVNGDIDAVAASAIAAELMTLDAVGDGHIELRLGSCGGTLDASLALIDVISVLGVSVRTLAMGSVEGGPIGVLVAGGRRAITPHGRLRLREPDGVVSGHARDLERAVAEHAAVRAGFLAHVACRVGRPYAEVEEEWARTSSLEAIDAVALGYVDEVLSRGAS